MRIDSLGRTIGGPAAARPGATRGGFGLADAPGPGRMGQAGQLRQAPSLDALMALQAYQEDGPRENKRRGIARGRTLLDALDGMKLALIDGRDDPATLKALAAEFADRRGPTGDAGLDDALAAIDLRAQVELAKRGL